MARRLGPRYFSGKLYPYWSTVYKKTSVAALKRQLREKGYKVRVVHGITMGKKVYVIYSRKV